MPLSVMAPDVLNGALSDDASACDCAFLCCLAGSAHSTIMKLRAPGNLKRPLSACSAAAAAECCLKTTTPHPCTRIRAWQQIRRVCLLHRRRRVAMPSQCTCRPKSCTWPPPPSPSCPWKNVPASLHSPAAPHLACLAASPWFVHSELD